MSVSRTNRIILLERELSRVQAEIRSNPGYYQNYDPNTGKSKLNSMLDNYDTKLRIEKEIDKINKGVDRETLINKIIC